MKSFDLYPQPRIVFGNGSIDQLGQLAAAWSPQRALVVSDPGIVATGHTARGMEALKNAGIEPYLFDDVHENPTTNDVERGVVAAQSIEPELIVGIGGGSSMDCAKGIIGPTACPCVTPNLAVRGLAIAWAAPSMEFSIASPAKQAPSCIPPRASISSGVASTRGKFSESNRQASRL